jgi:hypothetical protein
MVQHDVMVLSGCEQDRLRGGVEVCRTMFAGIVEVDLNRHVMFLGRTVEYGSGTLLSAAKSAISDRCDLAASIWYTESISIILHRKARCPRCDRASHQNSR